MKVTTLFQEKGGYSLAHQSSDTHTGSLVWDLLVAVAPRDLRSTLLGWTWQKHRKTVAFPYFPFSIIVPCHHIEHGKLHPLHFPPTPSWLSHSTPPYSW